MAILAYGINHKRADIQLRERLAVTQSTLPETLQDLLSHRAVNEAVLLSTCNRTEIIASSDDDPLLMKWMAGRYGVAESELHSHCYQHWGYDAAAHMMRVASGLDSMLVGEPQILGQVKQAYQVACDTGAVGSQLQQFFPAVFSASKKIRTETGIGTEAVSLAFLATKLAKRIFSDIKDCRVLLIGMGETNELIATHLHDQGVRQMTVANRSLLRAERFAKQFDAHLIPMTEVAEELECTDIVISATASQLPILGKGAVESAQVARKYRPLLLIDLAVPRDIERQVEQLEDVYLYNIDDLEQIIGKHQKNREAAAELAEQMVQKHAADYVQQLRVVGVSDMISEYRQQAVRMRDAEVEKALGQLKAGHAPDEVMAGLAKTITNKLLHQPTVELRQAAYDNEFDKLMLIKKIFGLK